MTIIYLHQYFNTPNMSGSTRSYEFAKKLVEFGHTVHIVTSWRDGTQEKEFTSICDGINVWWLPVSYSNKFGYLKRILAFVKFAYLAYRKTVNIKADVIFASSTPLTICLPGILAARSQSKPFIFEVRDLWPDVPIAVGAISNPLFKFLAKKLELFAYRNSQSIIALSEGMKSGIMKTGYPASSITVIPNISDLERFSPEKPERNQTRKIYNIQQDAIVILYPGTFGLINNVKYLIELAKLFLHDENVFFLMVGDGQDYDTAVELAKKYNCLNKNLFIEKSVPKNVVCNFFDAADIMISTVINIPELEANSANKFFDGLASGSCIAINHGGWQADIILHEQCGIVLSPKINIAYDQLKMLIQNREVIERAKINSRKVAEHFFDKNKLAVKFEKVFLDVVNKK